MPGHALPLFTPTPPSSLVCPVCEHVLKEPVWTCQLQHAACSTCTEAKDRCPSCPFESNQLAPLVRTASFVARLIDSLPITCPNACDVATLKLDSLEAHLAQCSNRPVACQNECGLTLSPAQLVKHRNSTCPLQLMGCARSRYIDEQGEKNWHCKFKREDKAEHDAACEYWKCRVEDCETRGTKKFVDLHQPDCEERYEQLADLWEQLESAEGYTEEVEEKLRAVEDELEEVSDSLKYADFEAEEWQGMYETEVEVKESIEDELKKVKQELEDVRKIKIEAVETVTKLQAQKVVDKSKSKKSSPGESKPKLNFFGVVIPVANKNKKVSIKLSGKSNVDTSSTYSDTSSGKRRKSDESQFESSSPVAKKPRNGDLGGGAS